MKKLSLAIVLSFIGISAFSQGFRAGLNVGLPSGDAEELHSFSLGLDINFFWQVTNTLDVGVATGYSNFFGEEVDFGSFGTVDVEDAGFIPLAGAARLYLSYKFIVGADLGYAIAITPDDSEGGYYYRPMLGYDISDSTQITVSYSGIEADDGSFAAILAGFNLSLGEN